MAKSRRSGNKTQGPKPIAEADKRQVLYDLGYVIDQLRGAYNLAFQNNPDQYAHNSIRRIMACTRSCPYRVLLGQ